MSVELFMVCYQVVILLHLLDLFDTSVFSQVSTSEILISVSWRIHEDPLFAF